MLQARFLTAGSDYVPDNVLGETTPPHFSKSSDGSKDLPLAHLRSSCPLAQSRLDPCGNGHCANVATFANQINHGPVSLAHLDVVELQAHQFRSAKTTTEQHGQHRVVAFCPHAVSPRMLEYFRTLLDTQPIAGTESELLDSFDAPIPLASPAKVIGSAFCFLQILSRACKNLRKIMKPEQFDLPLSG